MGKAVRGTNNKVIKRKLRIKIHGSALLTLGLVSSQFLVTKDNQLRIGMEYLFQSILNVICAAAANDLPAEIGGRKQNQMFFI